MIYWSSLMMMTALGGLTLMPATPVAAYEPAVAPWQVVAQTSIFSSTTGRFTVAFSGEPSTSSEMDDIDGTPTEIHEFSWEDGGSTYAVVYADLPASFLSLGTDAVLDTLRDEVIEDWELDGLEQLEINVQLSGYPGRRYRYSSADNTLDLRLYLVDERAYLLVAQDRDETAVNRFISSFSLL
ncbi:MAG: hypothetical protein AAGI45_02105 [Cyanobacteria bacterium P01_H01_bin.26]